MRHSWQAYGTELSPDGRLIASYAIDGNVRLWDAASGSAWSPWLAHGSPVRAADFSPDGSELATVDHSGKLRVWEVLPARAPVAILDHQAEQAAWAAFSPDAERLATVSVDGALRVWDVAGGRLLAGPVPGGGRWVSFDPAGELVVADGASARLWKPGETPIELHRDVTRAAFSPDGQTIVTASRDGTARLWDRQGKPLAQMQHEGPVLWAEFRADGRWLLTNSSQGARVWDVATGKKLFELPGGSAVAHFSPQGDKVVSADAQGRVYVAAIGGDRIQVAAVGPGPDDALAANLLTSAAAFHPSGELLAVASKDGTVRTWELATGLLAMPSVRHQGPVIALTFSSDGQRLLTASKDGTARVWEVATGLPLGEPVTHAGIIYGADFSPDARLVATASWDGTVRITGAGADLSRPLGELRRRVERQTGLTRDDDEQSAVPVVRPLSPEEWLTLSETR